MFESLKLGQRDDVAVRGSVPHRLLTRCVIVVKSEIKQMLLYSFTSTVTRRDVILRKLASFIGQNFSFEVHR